MSAFDIHTDPYELARIAQGDEDAFAQFFHAWQPFLATHIFRITESRPLTEEIVQDVFLKIWQARESLGEIQNVKAYLLAVSKNHAINVLKKAAKEFSRREKYLKDSAVPEDEQTQLYYSLIDEAVDRLSDRQKQVYLLSRHERLTYQQIADRLGIGKETVKTHIELAVKHISVYVKGRLAAAIILFLLQR